MLIAPHHPDLSIRRQCELLGLSRASYYREPADENTFNLELMREIDEEYTRAPFYGLCWLPINMNSGWRRREQ